MGAGQCREKKEFIFDKKLTLFFFLLFIWAGLTALITKGHIVKTDISNIWEYSPIILFPLFLQTIKIKKERIIMVLFFFSSIVCVLGILQYNIPSISYPFPRQLVFTRFQGFFSNALHASGFYSIIVILTLSLILFFKCNKKNRFSLVLFFILNMIALLISMSRSYYISIVFVIPFLMLIKGWRWFAISIVAIGTFFTVCFSFQNIINSRTQTLFDLNFSSNAQRLIIWETAIMMAKDHPLIGVGPGNWEKEAVVNYFPIIEKETRRKMPAYGHAHNTYLTWLSESGIPGLLLFLTFWALVVKRLLQVKSIVKKGSFDYALIVGTIAALANLFIAGLFEHNFGTSVILLLITFLIGLSLRPSED